MSHIKKILIVLIMIFILMIIYACASKNSVFKIESSDELYVPGQTYQLKLNHYIKDVLQEETPEGFTFTIEEGGEFAEISDILELSISSDAPVGTVIKIKASNGESECSYQVTVSKVAVTGVSISASDNEIIIGRSMQIAGGVTPDNATYKDITYEITEGEDYSNIDSNGLLTVSDEALPDSTISVKGTADGVDSNILDFTIHKVPVSSVTLSADSSAVAQGGTLQLNSTILPEDATYRTVTYSITSGSEYAYIDENGLLTVHNDTQSNVEICIKATADGVDSELYTVTVSELQITGVVLSSSRDSVEINGTAEISSEILPYSIEGITVGYEITQGAEYATLVDGVLTVLSNAPSGYNLKIVGWAIKDGVEIENTRSDELIISVYRVSVTSVTLSTEDNISLVEADGTVNFSVTVYPENATVKTPQFVILPGGANYATIGNFTGVLTVLKNNEDQTVSVEAIVDGVHSNAVTVTTAKYFYTVSDIPWNSFDYTGSIFSGYRNIRLMIKDMPEDAALSTVIVPSTVKRMIIEGSYSSVVPNTVKNLYFYFYRAEEFELTLLNAGIETTLRSSYNIFDFPEDSDVTITITGENYIKAGSAINPYDYSVDGVYDELNENVEYLKNGMDGYNGDNGGTAISGYNLDFVGTGSLYILGGNGASGSHGGDGADLPSDANPLTFSGSGGHGGMGGDGGYAVFGYNITVDMSLSATINAFSGNAGSGGEGGLRGQAIPGCSYGEAGEDGIDGTVVSAIAAYNNYNNISGNVYQTMGSVISSWTAPPIETINEMILRTESIYGVDMHVKSDLYAPYTEYPMTQLNDDNSIIYMLRIIDNVLSKFSDNLFREIRILSNKVINIYIVNTIKAGAVAGLASTDNNIWLAYSTAAIRNIFYSDVENFAFHEMTHILIYNTNGMFTETALKSFNNNTSYISSGTYYSYVYNGDNWTKDNSYYLTTYSRRNYQEDICETLSMISRQGKDWDFLDSGTYIRAKMLYIAQVLENAYETVNFYEAEVWEKFL